MKQLIKGSLLLPVLAVLLALPARAVHLQDVYDQAGPGRAMTSS